MANQWVPSPEMLGNEREKMVRIFISYLPVQDESEESGGQLSAGVQKVGGSTGLAFRGVGWAVETCLGITSMKPVMGVDEMA